MKLKAKMKGKRSNCCSAEMSDNLSLSLISTYKIFIYMLNLVVCDVPNEGSHSKFAAVVYSSSIRQFFNFLILFHECVCFLFVFSSIVDLILVEFVDGVCLFLSHNSIYTDTQQYALC